MIHRVAVTREQAEMLDRRASIVHKVKEAHDRAVMDFELISDAMLVGRCPAGTVVRVVKDSSYPYVEVEVADAPDQ